MRTVPKSFGSQSGVVLPVSLFILIAATLMTLAMVKANMSSLRVGGASVIAAETQATAELRMNNFFSLNPLVDLATNSRNKRYMVQWAGCSGGAFPYPPPLGVDYFDCRPHVTAVASDAPIQVLPAETGAPPRRSTPTEFKYQFNYFHVTSAQDNPGFGSHAQVGVGIASFTEKSKQ